MSVTDHIKRKLNGFGISTRITLGYAACFFVFFFILNVVTWIGAMQVLFAPAEKTIKFSTANVKAVIEEIENNYDYYNPKKFRDALVPGVVLRAIDSEGNKLVDTDEINYPSVEWIYKGMTDSPPLMADKDLLVSQIGNALIYCDEMICNIDGKEVTFYFFRTITSEWTLFDNLEKLLIGLDVFGMILALIFGYFLSRRILKPIRIMNDLAREIAFEKLSKRIPIGEAHDELNELAKTLNKMLDRLQGGINKQQKFVSDASHELRTPATVIAGYIEMLERYGMDDKELVNESIEAIRSEAHNMQNLLENLLFIARTDQNRQKLNKKNLDLNDLVNDVMSKMKTVIKTHEVKLTRNDTVKIFGDETTIRQMLRIFLDNAVKYTPEGGKISVASQIVGEKILLTISDSGIGIAPENLKKIFDRFFRIDSENLVSAANGSGLGLSIAKWIADSHGIEISVDSTPGEGTTFTLTIPKLEIVDKLH